MPHISRRDLVGLAMLVAGFAVALVFLVPGTGDEKSTTITQGDVLPTATPTVAPTATPIPIPVLRLSQPASWYIRFYRGKDPTGAVLDTETFSPTLDLVFRGAPFNDMQDDNWSVSVSADIPVEAGRNTFSLEYQGAVRVLRDHVEIASATSQALTKSLDISLEAATPGRINLEIQGADIGGPFSLSWK